MQQNCIDFLSAFENWLRTGLVYHILWTNPAVKRKNAKWHVVRGISPAGEKKVKWWKGFAKEPNLTFRIKDLVTERHAISYLINNAGVRDVKEAAWDANRYIDLNDSSAIAGKPRCRMGTCWPKYKWKTIGLLLCTKCRWQFSHKKTL